MSILSMSDIGINYIFRDNKFSRQVLAANAKSDNERNDIPFLLPLTIQRMTDTNPTMEATATYATSAVTDDFESGLYGLKIGEISPNGKWKDI